MSASPPQPDTRAEVAALRAAGYAVCKPDPGTKQPTYKNWPTHSLEPADFQPGEQVGIITGALSNGGQPGHALVVVDLDSPAAVAKAEEFLPQTGMIEGRPGKPRSRWFYLVPVASIPEWGKSRAPQAAPAAEAVTGHPGPFLKHFRLRTADGTPGAGVLDFLGTGGCIVVPPSVHPSGEQREWEGGRRGVPAIVGFSKLWSGVADLADDIGAVVPRVLPRVATPTVRQVTTETGDIAKRARAYLSKLAPAVSGSGGHNQTFKAAKALVWGFDLDLSTAFDLLAGWNQGCQPPWSEPELWHKVHSADETPSDEPRGHLKNATRPQAKVQFTASRTTRAPGPATNGHHAEAAQDVTGSPTPSGEGPDQEAANERHDNPTGETDEPTEAPTLVWTAEPAGKTKHLVKGTQGNEALVIHTMNLADEQERNKLAKRTHEKYPGLDVDDLKAALLELAQKVTTRTALSTAPAEATPSGKAVVIVSPDEHLTNDDAAAALGEAPNLFEYGKLLVRLAGRQPSERFDRKIRRQEDGLVIDPHDTSTIREVLTRVAEFRNEYIGPNGPESVKVHVPNWCAAAVLRRKAWDKVPDLAGVVSYPVMLPGGRLVTAPGYDAESGLYQTGDYRGLVILDNPTQDDARAAAVVLADVVQDFPFEQECDKSAWMCGILSPLARQAYEGPTPLHLCTANTPGSGKSLLNDIISQIVADADFARVAYPGEATETKKVITAIVIAGDRMVLFDNVSGRLGDSALDMALTATRWRDRLLGGNQMFDGPLNVIFYATGNNVELGADAPRRILPCRLKVEEENPEDRPTSEFKYPLPGWARQNRSRLLAAALTILRAYELAGRPDPVRDPEGGPNKPLKAWGSYEGWSTLVRASLVWAGQADPCEGREQLRREADTTGQAMAGLLAKLAEFDTVGNGYTAREIIKWAGLLKGSDQAPESGWDVVADFLATLGAENPNRLGCRLRKYKGRIFGGLRIDPSDKGVNGQRWYVTRVPDRKKPSTASSTKPAPPSDLFTPPDYAPEHRQPEANCRNPMPDGHFHFGGVSTPDYPDYETPRPEAAEFSADDGPPNPDGIPW